MAEAHPHRVRVAALCASGLACRSDTPLRVPAETSGVDLTHRPDLRRHRFGHVGAHSPGTRLLGIKAAGPQSEEAYLAARYRLQRRGVRVPSDVEPSSAPHLA